MLQFQFCNALFGEATHSGSQRERNAEKRSNKEAKEPVVCNWKTVRYSLSLTLRMYFSYFRCSGMPFPANSASKPIFVRQYEASENEKAREKSSAKRKKWCNFSSFNLLIYRLCVCASERFSLHWHKSQVSRANHTEKWNLEEIWLENESKRKNKTSMNRAAALAVVVVLLAPKKEAAKCNEKKCVCEIFHWMLIIVAHVISYKSVHTHSDWECEPCTSSLACVRSVVNLIKFDVGLFVWEMRVRRA